MPLQDMNNLRDTLRSTEARHKQLLQAFLKGLPDAANEVSCSTLQRGQTTHDKIDMGVGHLQLWCVIYCTSNQSLARGHPAACMHRPAACALVLAGRLLQTPIINAGSVLVVQPQHIAWQVEAASNRICDLPQVALLWLGESLVVLRLCCPKSVCHACTDSYYKPCNAHACPCCHV